MMLTCMNLFHLSSNVGLVAFVGPSPVALSVVPKISKYHALQKFTEIHLKTLRKNII